MKYLINFKEVIITILTTKFNPIMHPDVLKQIIRFFIFSLLLMLFFSCSSSTETIKTLPEKDLFEELKSSFAKKEFQFLIPSGSKIDSIDINSSEQIIRIETNNRFSFRPFREIDIYDITNEIRTFLGAEYFNFEIEIYSLGMPIEKLIPNYYLENKNNIDSSRIPKRENITPLVTNINKGYEISKGLNGRHIALWHSHGWYYNHELKRWMWQRARLFRAVEDLGTFTFTVPYLIPMLENGGANVFVPRERDVQTEEIVVDNNGSSSGKYIEVGTWTDVDTTGFAIGTPPYANNLNPFLQGSYRKIKSSRKGNRSVSYIPNFKTAGNYAVYISYKHSEKNISDAKYKVFHLGGVTEFSVNQQIGGETWIYLGTFKFAKGENKNIGQVLLSNKSNEDGFVTTDAVRFGGGMGIVERDGTTSGRPKFVEGARYYLQYAGMPDTLVYDLNKNIKDYNDDYQSRAEWVNYLKGTPFGPNKNRSAKGLGIPIDLSLSFHTDAGITSNDTVIGTLQIYSLEDAEDKQIFPDGVSRLANRDLSDIMQTQIVNDLRAKYDSAWTRRQIMEAGYSEAFRPNVPATLLELLSHQNLQDVKFMNDPQFRFDVSRSIYKSMLRFLSAQNNFEYVVQPLPVTHFAAEMSDSGTVTLSWKPKNDPIESTAKASRYKVYTRIDDNGFDNGVVVPEPNYIAKNIKPNKIYSFKITALNDGGESFPSEILSVYWNGKDGKPLLIINGFDRISTAAIIEADNFSGFVDAIDEGVPDKYDIGYVGAQHDFTPDSKWKTDDVPGHGASYANMETKIFVGNTFDFPFIHGQSIANAEFSFVSVSDEAVEDSIVNLNNYQFVDLIYGEEKETSWQTPYADSVNGKRFKIFPPKMKKAISEYLSSGGNLFLSGAYLGSDMFLNKNKNSDDAQFAAETLKYRLASDHAVKAGNVEIVNTNIKVDLKQFSFNTEFNKEIYRVEAPDALGAINGSETFLRYSENLYSAGVAYNKDYGIVALGFPFETITSKTARDEIMKAILKYLNIK
ncbi:MAG: fibronectin type III domain-containing protein [Melioribacteraceae bacterium]|nr:fibronectin type III domain-containing protein [Melioribacteraceae bacterium]